MKLPDPLDARPEVIVDFDCDEGLLTGLGLAPPG